MIAEDSHKELARQELAEIEGCERLWRAVINQLFDDAKGGAPGALVAVSFDDWREAREWLLFDEVDFPLVCDWAGFNPKIVRARAWKMEAAGELSFGDFCRDGADASLSDAA